MKNKQGALALRVQTQLQARVYSGAHAAFVAQSPYQAWVCVDGGNGYGRPANHAHVAPPHTQCAHTTDSSLPTNMCDMRMHAPMHPPTHLRYSLVLPAMRAMAAIASSSSPPRMDSVLLPRELAGLRELKEPRTPHPGMACGALGERAKPVPASPPPTPSHTSTGCDARAWRPCWAWWRRAGWEVGLVPGECTGERERGDIGSVTLNLPDLYTLASGIPVGSEGGRPGSLSGSPSLTLSRLMGAACGKCGGGGGGDGT